MYLCDKIFLYGILHGDHQLIQRMPLLLTETLYIPAQISGRTFKYHLGSELISEAVTRY